MGKFDLIIFDCDGVLVDSELIGNQALASVLGDHGIQISGEQARELYTGLSVGEIGLRVEKRFGFHLPESWIAEYYRRMIPALAENVLPIKGVTEVVQRVQQAGLRFCVASQGPVEKTRASLTATGLWPAFQNQVFSAKNVPHPKPAPDLFLHAAATNHAPPQKCVVVEDSSTGVVAARAAGMTVYAYCPAGDIDGLKELGAIPFQSMADLPGLLGIA